MGRLRARRFERQTATSTNPLRQGCLDHHILRRQGGTAPAAMPPSSALLAPATVEAPFRHPRLRGKSPFRFAAKQTLLQFGDFGFEDLDLARLFLLLNQCARMQVLVIMSLLAQPDVLQPKFFLNLSHRKARLPEDGERVPKNMLSRENTL